MRTAGSIGGKPLDNTQRGLAEMLAITPLRVHLIVNLMYPKSKQPEKKAVTFTRHLRAMERRGIVQQVDGLWFLTGRYQIEGGGPPPKPPAPLRLAS